MPRFTKKVFQENSEVVYQIWQGESLINKVKVWRCDIPLLIFMFTSPATHLKYQFIRAHKQADKELENLNQYAT